VRFFSLGDIYRRQLARVGVIPQSDYHLSNRIRSSRRISNATSPSSNRMRSRSSIPGLKRLRTVGSQRSLRAGLASNTECNAQRA